MMGNFSNLRAFKIFLLLRGLVKSRIITFKIIMWKRAKVIFLSLPYFSPPHGKQNYSRTSRIFLFFQTYTVILEFYKLFTFNDMFFAFLEIEALFHRSYWSERSCLSETWSARFQKNISQTFIAPKIFAAMLLAKNTGNAANFEANSRVPSVPRLYEGCIC